jgi:hypothetical protein
VKYARKHGKVLASKKFGISIPWVTRWSNTFGEGINKKKQIDAIVELTGNRKLIYNLLVKAEQQQSSVVETNAEIARLIISA